jgi:membrane fusion protein, hemolysin D
MTDVLGSVRRWRFPSRPLGSLAHVVEAGATAWAGARQQLRRAVAALRAPDRAWLPRRRRGPPIVRPRIAKEASDLDEEPPEPDLHDILLERPPKLLRGPHYVAALLFVLVFVLAAVLRVDVIVAARGKLVPDGPPIVLQPLDRGVIRQIRVKVGDAVTKGEILATLDATFTAADSASLSAQQSALQAQLRRLKAELDGTPLTAPDRTADELLQLNLYNQRQAQYSSRLNEFDAAIARDQTALRGAQDALGVLARQLDIARQIEAMRMQLYKGAIGSKLNYLDAQATRMSVEHQYQDERSKAAELTQTLRSATAERETFVDDWRRELLEELAKARTTDATVSESLTKAERLNNLVVLRAPADGIVLDVAKRSVGSVLNPAEPLITLVPSETPLIAQVMIASGDVGYAKPGDNVVVKVDAFPYQRNGFLAGRLRSIAEDSFSPTNPEPGAAAVTGGSVHQSEVSLMSTKLHDLPAGTHLIPGMTVTAEVNVGSRSVLSYFLYPLSGGLRDSFREP